MSSLQEGASSSMKRNNQNLLKQQEPSNTTPSEDQSKGVDKKFKWYEDPALQADESAPMTPTKDSSLCSYIWMGFLTIVFLPIILVGFILLLLFWILPGFGWFYERYAEARDRKKYYPPKDEMKSWGPDNTLIHVVHLLAPESRLPPIVYLSGMAESMYVVKPLLQKFAENMNEPVEIISFDLPGYGASEPPADWSTENADTTLLLLRNVVEKSAIRKPFILEGGSAGGPLVQLYRLTYPKDIAGIVLFDPTPLNAFEPGSPVAKELILASSLFKKMALAASWGLLRPLLPLISHFGIGKFSDTVRFLPSSFVALSTTQTTLLKMANQIHSLRDITKRVSQLPDNSSIHRNTPVLVITAHKQNEKRPCDGLTQEELGQWSKQNHQSFVCNFDNGGFVLRPDRTHVQCLADMKLAANATKAVLTQIRSHIA